MFTQPNTIRIDGRPALGRDSRNDRQSNFTLRAIAALALMVNFMPSTAQAAAVMVNGTCYVGNCATPDTVASGGSKATAFSIEYTFANGDRYLITGSANAGTGTAGAPTLSVPFNVEYLGNGANGPSQADSLTISVTQNAVWNTTSSSAKAVGISITFAGPIETGSTATAQAETGSILSSTVGPFYAPTNGSSTLDITIPARTGTYLTGEFRTYVFAAGSLPGADIANGSATPVEYAGSLDSASCSTGMTGWVANKAALNTSLSFNWTATKAYSTQAASSGTAAANLLRTDVAALLGDNGLHGYDISVPSGVRDGTTYIFSTTDPYPAPPVYLTCPANGGSGTRNFNGPGFPGIFRSGQWWLDLNGDDQWTPAADSVFTYGIAGDVPMLGDWDNTGRMRIGIFRNGQWWLDIDGDGQWTQGVDTVFTFGQAGDVPIFGDWTNSGVKRVGIFRSGEWWLDLNNDHAWTQGADTVFTYGQAGDIPLFGDWTGTGVDRVGIFRSGQWWLDINNDHGWTNGVDTVFTYGEAGDVPMLADWTNSGVQRIGIFRGGQWWLDINNDHAWTAGVDTVFTYGQAGDVPVPGK